MIMSELLGPMADNDRSRMHSAMKVARSSGYVNERMWVSPSISQ